METIKESVKILESVERHRGIINKFARNKYEEKFGNERKPDDGYHGYSGFEVLSENSIKVNYEYGAGDMDFIGSFIVELD